VNPQKVFGAPIQSSLLLAESTDPKQTKKTRDRRRKNVRRSKGKKIIRVYFASGILPTNGDQAGIGYLLKTWRGTQANKEIQKEGNEGIISVWKFTGAGKRSPPTAKATISYRQR